MKIIIIIIYDLFYNKSKKIQKLKEVDDFLKLFKRYFELLPQFYIKF